MVSRSKKSGVSSKKGPWLLTAGCRLRFSRSTKSNKAERPTSSSKFQRYYWPTFCLQLFAFCLLLSACTTKSESPAQNHSPKFQQYYVHGEQLYLKHCSNCHQKTGTGLGLLYPPLNQSDFLDHNLERVVCIMKNGTKGELIVNGKSFNKEMPGIPSLTDIEVAEIATFLYNTWNRDRGIIEVRDVSQILLKCDSLSVNR